MRVPESLGVEYRLVNQFVNTLEFKVPARGVGGP